MKETLQGSTSESSIFNVYIQIYFQNVFLHNIKPIFFSKIIAGVANKYKSRESPFQKFNLKAFSGNSLLIENLPLQFTALQRTSYLAFFLSIFYMQYSKLCFVRKQKWWGGVGMINSYSWKTAPMLRCDKFNKKYFACSLEQEHMLGLILTSRNNLDCFKV